MLRQAPSGIYFTHWHHACLRPTWYLRQRGGSWNSGRYSVPRASSSSAITMAGTLRERGTVRRPPAVAYKAFF